MSILETKIENRACEIAKNELGIASIKLNVSGNTGIPDRLFLIPGGKPLFIEFKRPGGVVSAKQKFWIKLLTKLKFKVKVCDSVEEAIKNIKEEMETP